MRDFVEAIYDFSILSPVRAASSQGALPPFSLASRVARGDAHQGCPSCG
jgi:hypothetical protein